MCNVFEAAHQADCIQAAERLGLQLKRSGSRYFTRCLFHAEHTPSMCLYPDGGGFYCFGCNEHGDAIKLYQQALGLSPIEAAKRICADFGFTYNQKRSSKPQQSIPYRLPNITAHTIAKRLTAWREEQVQQLLIAQRNAETQMERIEARFAENEVGVEAALEDSDWQAAFQRKCMAQERIAVLDGLTLPELLEQMKEEMHGET